MSDKMINSTSKPDAGSVLTDTLKDMNEFDMNVLNDTIAGKGKK